ncbi:unnamed protein product [Rangifer tarandus platyrhynchus]|uniref:Transforming acidic coiled-coil-containing protein C-terminal domain-containing protein n=2 Tax=Rangifer tarandus platyrhynchus TaxID=3082113 RepID=A0ABN8ZIG1_RANTA|nr:unnamed protein product [Rangifer tarandus platyrhynchus]CAI9707932.1 unnamed protein product [Rangifer tarandus platyrhynchus]
MFCLKNRCDELHMEHPDVGKATGGFERIVNQAIEEAQKEKELDKSQYPKVQKEKDPLLQDWTPGKTLSLTSAGGLRNRRPVWMPLALQ